MEWDKARRGGVVWRILHCMDFGAGARLPLPPGERTRGALVGENLRFNYLNLGASDPLPGAPRGRRGAARTRWCCWTTLVVSCGGAGAGVHGRSADHNPQMVRVGWALRVFVSGTTRHFETYLIALLCDPLGARQCFSVSNWSKGAVERINREVTKTLKAVLNLARSRVSKRSVVTPVAQWALHIACRAQMGITPCHVMMGRKPRAVCFVLRRMVKPR